MLVILGIDLGTTNSVAAFLGENGPKLIKNALGEVLTPSVVALDKDGQLLVGATAREYQVTYPERSASLFKRHMGTSWTTTIDDREFTPEQLSSLILASFKQDAEVQLGEPIDRAVITVPAYFNDRQRKATIRAGELAGFQVDRIINEPTAAALAYGLHDNRERIVTVIDLGGGTFDVSIVDMFDGAIEVRASSGESFLGGEDFTSAMASRLLEKQGLLFERAEMQSPAMVSRLLQQCERAKRQLTSSETADVRVPDENGEIGDPPTIETISREQFEKWTNTIMTRLEMPIRRTLGDAGLTYADVDDVVLVGGATRMPALGQRIETLLRKVPTCHLNPDEVVALGAAVQAGLVARSASVDDLVVTDVAPFTLGVETAKQLGSDMRQGYFLPIINRNTTIPVSRVSRVETIRPNQTEVRVKVYQGESRMVEDNLLLGEFMVRNIPRGPAGQSIDIRLTYDLNGVLEVEAVVVETQEKRQLVISRYTDGMSDDQIASALQEMQTLKTHPREDAQNRFLLKRGERLYRELPLSERQYLSELIDGFETALDLQEKEAIERFRDELKAVLDRLENGLESDEYDPDEF